MTILDESPLLSPVPDSISPSPEPIPLDDRKLRSANLATVDPDPEAADLLVKVKAKQEWVKGLRLKFCVRPEFEITKNMIHEDGTLNQDYFRPPKGAKPEEARKWTDREKELLLRGIEKHGIGHFREISDEFLPAWSGNDLRLKTIRLIGRQNLQLYRSWRGTAADVSHEYDRNKKIGLRFGTWKQGVLVYDDDGKVEAEILRTESVSEGALEVNESVRGIGKRRREANVDLEENFDMEGVEENKDEQGKEDENKDGYPTIVVKIDETKKPRK